MNTLANLSTKLYKHPYAVSNSIRDKVIKAMKNGQREIAANITKQKGCKTSDLISEIASSTKEQSWGYEAIKKRNNTSKSKAVDPEKIMPLDEDDVKEF